MIIWLDLWQDEPGNLRRQRTAFGTIVRLISTNRIQHTVNQPISVVSNIIFWCLDKPRKLITCMHNKSSSSPNRQCAIGLMFSPVSSLYNTALCRYRFFCTLLTSQLAADIPASIVIKSLTITKRYCICTL
jgi:hypothetical protein